MPRFKISVDSTWWYRWRLVAEDGMVMAESSTAFRDKDACLTAIVQVKQDAPVAWVEGVESEEAPWPGSET